MKTKKKSLKMYSMKLACVNCHHLQTRKVTKGITLDTWLEQKPKCTFCDCVETLQSIHEYSVRKKMFEEFLNAESHGHPVQEEAPDHQHFA